MWAWSCSHLSEEQQQCLAGRACHLQSDMPCVCIQAVAGSFDPKTAMFCLCRGPAGGQVQGPHRALQVIADLSGLASSAEGEQACMPSAVGHHLMCCSRVPTGSRFWCVKPQWLLTCSKFERPRSWCKVRASRHQPQVCQSVVSSIMSHTLKCSCGRTLSTNAGCQSGSAAERLHHGSNAAAKGLTSLECHDCREFQLKQGPVNLDGHHVCGPFPDSISGCREPEEDDSAPWKEQENWEGAQIKKALQPVGSKGKKAPQYDFVFEDQIQFITEAAAQDESVSSVLYCLLSLLIQGSWGSA